MCGTGFLSNVDFVDYWKQIAAQLSECAGVDFSSVSVRKVSGGCINEAVVLGAGSRRVFVKINDQSRRNMFEAEADGLRELRASGVIQVPEVLCCGEVEGKAWLGLECIEFGGQSNQSELGRRLALLHQRSAPRFGWHRDNTIGSTRQKNSWSDDWTRFWREERLGFQFDLAKRRGTAFARSEEVLTRIEEWFDGYSPKPSLLHGDLWSGNIGFTNAGSPVIFDPAVYYGDREAEFGIIEMFGGFGAEFYRAYCQASPFADGFERRKYLYLLYHQLNHFNLFGKIYAPQVRASIRCLLNK